jgi:hypothetical protein
MNSLTTTAGEAPKSDRPAVTPARKIKRGNSREDMVGGNETDGDLLPETRRRKAGHNAS